ncbi:MAG: NADP-dependent malic enzyme [Neomegalonema sp.]|nr:NADP-dependent malic enzyme [Neomegalonema sp.]
MPDNPIESGANEAKDPKSFRERALAYHAEPRPGKLEIRATKPLGQQRDLALAYSPGVAEACLEIKADPSTAARYTARANLVAVVSNGTAALGLGDIGALASKPIMEGKAVLFKKFAGIDVFDIEVDEKDPEKLAEIVRALEPTFGAVNLEDIKAPECFIVEKRCREKMSIPVFHDDQHGTAIVVGAAATNALHLVDKPFDQVKIVSTGGGAAGIACLNMLMKLGAKRENIWLADLDGVVHTGREAGMTPEKAAFAQETSARTLDEIIEGADVFLGLSGPNVLKPEMVARMAKSPIILALANPTPEIMPEAAREVRPDAIIATGRSDYPNQVNNVLCFPFIFRGALDVGATEINDEMEVACVRAIADLARQPVAAEAARAYAGETLIFGPEYLIPKPFDPRLLAAVSGAVAEAAAASGVATRPIEDHAAYRQQLDRFVYRSGLLMRPIFAAARASASRIVFAEGEDERVLQATNALIEEGIGRPILIGRPRVMEARAEKLGLPIRIGDNVEICNPEDDPRYNDYWRDYHLLTERDGVTPDVARAILRTNSTAIAAVMVARGEADAMICGALGQYRWHLRYVQGVLGRGPGGKRREPIGAMTTIILDQGPIFIADCHLWDQPSAEQLATIACAAAQEIRRFGLTPRAAFISHSNFGSEETPASLRMRLATALMEQKMAEGAVEPFEFEGEMNMEVALNRALQERTFPNSRLSGPANLFLMPDLDAASVAKHALKALAGGLQLGPLLLGYDGLANIVTPSITARGVLNIGAYAAAQQRD